MIFFCFYQQRRLHQQKRLGKEWVRRRGLRSGGLWFVSSLVLYCLVKLSRAAQVAQLVEPWTCDWKIAGSDPCLEGPCGTISIFSSVYVPVFQIWKRHKTEALGQLLKLFLFIYLFYIFLFSFLPFTCCLCFEENNCFRNSRWKVGRKKNMEIFTLEILISFWTWVDVVTSCCCCIIALLCLDWQTSVFDEFCRQKAAELYSFFSVVETS